MSCDWLWLWLALEEGDKFGGSEEIGVSGNPRRGRDSIDSVEGNCGANLFLLLNFGSKLKSLVASLFKLGNKYDCNVGNFVAYVFLLLVVAQSL